VRVPREPHAAARDHVDRVGDPVDLVRRLESRVSCIQKNTIIYNMKLRYNQYVPIRSLDYSACIRNLEK
jgi:hypothetical protein